MQMYDIISNKKYGKELSREEIEYFISGYVKNEIPDYMISALLMAICLKGMTDRETADLTDIMMHSGDTVDLSCFGENTADKHSTGGVGDKTSLVVAPIVAALGGKVAKMSGRGLGHTGGTVDKLESIPGYKTALTADEFIKQVDSVGIAVIGQTGNLVPADKKLYALRDLTATVDSIPLITSSIMSKKLAAGSKTIVLDVKTGSGAFMKTPQEAKKLAEKMVEIGRLCGRKMSALITDMDTPLGTAVGNSLEVIEAVGVLKGEVKGDIKEVCAALASEMVAHVKNISVHHAAELVEDVISSGKAYEKMKEWIAAQGGDVSYIEDVSKFPVAAYSLDITAGCDGYISHTNTELIGHAAALLGAGRSKKDEPIDFSAGIKLYKKTGSKVLPGDAICTLYTNKKESLAAASESVKNALIYSDKAPEKIPLIYEIVR